MTFDNTKLVYKTQNIHKKLQTKVKPQMYLALKMRKAEQYATGLHVRPAGEGIMKQNNSHGHKKSLKKV